jgi:hypothetical protein
MTILIKGYLVEHTDEGWIETMHDVEKNIDGADHQ